MFRTSFVNRGSSADACAPAAFCASDSVIVVMGTAAAVSVFVCAVLLRLDITVLATASISAILLHAGYGKPKK